MTRSTRILWLLFIPFILLACAEPVPTRESSSERVWPTPVPVSTTVPPTSTLMPTPTLVPTHTLGPTAAPAVVETPTSEPISNVPLVKIISAGANIRSGPGIENAAVAVLAHGATAELISISDDGQWYHVALPTGGAGWVGSSVAELLEAPVADE